MVDRGAARVSGTESLAEGELIAARARGSGPRGEA
jgi:hypothetical protein